MKLNKRKLILYYVLVFSAYKALGIMIRTYRHPTLDFAHFFAPEELILDILFITLVLWVFVVGTKFFFKKQDKEPQD